MCLDLNDLKPLITRMKFVRSIFVALVVATMIFGGAFAHAGGQGGIHGMAELEVSVSAKESGSFHQHTTGAHDHAVMDHPDTGVLDHHSDAYCCGVGACGFIVVEYPLFVSMAIARVVTTISGKSYRSRSATPDSPPPRTFI